VQHIVVFMAFVLSLPGASLLWLTAQQFRARFAAQASPA
jgi:hypothetical protein